MGVEVNDVSMQEILSQFTGLHLLGSVSSLELPVFLFTDVSSNLSRHLLSSTKIISHITITSTPHHKLVID